MRTMLIASMLVLLIACNGASPTANDVAGTAPIDLVGSFALSHYNGAELPVDAVRTISFKATVVGGSIQFREDSTYIEIRTSRLLNQQGVSESTLQLEGAYSVTGTALRMTLTGRDGLGVATTTGTLSESSIIVTRRVEFQGDVVTTTSTYKR